MSEVIDFESARLKLVLSQEDGNFKLEVAALDDCKNGIESYGMICVRCNKCGRFGSEDKESET